MKSSASELGLIGKNVGGIHNREVVFKILAITGWRKNGAVKLRQMRK